MVTYSYQYSNAAKKTKNKKKTPTTDAQMTISLNSQINQRLGLIIYLANKMLTSEIISYKSNIIYLDMLRIFLRYFLKLKISDCQLVQVLKYAAFDCL